jgi:uncharacterized protein
MPGPCLVSAARRRPGRGASWPALALLAGLLLTLAAASGRAQLSEPKFPALTGRIVDEARLLTAEDRSAIEAELTQLESKSTDQLVVVTLRSLQGFDIADYGYRLGRAWGIGQQGKNNGILLIVAPQERKVRIEVGRGLEPVMTDLLSGLIIQNTILPRFRRGEFSAGIRAGVSDIKSVLLGDAAEVEARAKRDAKGPESDPMALVILAIWLAIVLFVIWAHFRQARHHPQSLGRRGKRDGGIVFVPGGSGNWGGGGWGGGGSGGGGWSGGGGDFGGGGSSGSW